MSPRKKLLADDDVARVAAAVLLESGSAAVTFAEVAERCGLAPPTLVQRFGSRAGMLEAARATFRSSITEAFSGSRVPGLAGLREGLRRLGQLPALVGVLDAQASLELRKQISFGLAQAIEMGELPRCDIAVLARSLQIAFYGALALAAMENLDASAEALNALDQQLSAFI